MTQFKLPIFKSPLSVLSTLNGGIIGGVFGKRVIIDDIGCLEWGKRQKKLKFNFFYNISSFSFSRAGRMIKFAIFS